MSKRNRNARNTAPGRSNDRLVLGAGVIVVAALIAFVIFRSNRSTPVASIPPAPAPAAAATDHDHAAESSVRRITAPEVRTALDRGEAVVVDVRDIDSYAAGHVAGAMHIPLEFIESQVPYLPRGKMLVTYCTWPAEESSARAALIMKNAGITNVAALVGGLDAWRNAGFAVETGTQGPRL